MFSEVHKRAKKAGQPPGTLTYTGDQSDVTPEFSVTTFYDQEYNETHGSRLEDCAPIDRSKGSVWINVEGLRDVKSIEKLAEIFNLHPLTVEDILNVGQRSKVEEFQDYLFITLKVIEVKHRSHFVIRQLSLVLGKNFVLSFQEYPSDLFDSLQARLKSVATQRLRQHGIDYLAYRLIDIVVDQYFVVLDRLGDRIERLEDRIIVTPKPNNPRAIYRIKRQLLILRRAIWPMRETISHLLQVEDSIITDYTRVYLRDVYDHTVQAIDTLEIFRDILASMMDMYLSSLSNRMNEIMKTLTIIATIFIPITALASIYGMNFKYMPELSWHLGFPMVISVMCAIAIGMLIYFKIKKWI